LYSNLFESLEMNDENSWRIEYQRLFWTSSQSAVLLTYSRQFVAFADEVSSAPSCNQFYIPVVVRACDKLISDILNQLLIPQLWHRYRPIMLHAAIVKFNDCRLSWTYTVVYTVIMCLSLIFCVNKTRKDVGAECRHNMRPSAQLPSLSGIYSKLDLTFRLLTGHADLNRHLKIMGLRNELYVPSAKMRRKLQFISLLSAVL